MDLNQYFKKAQKEGFAVGQFNFSTLEQLRGILKAGKNLETPLILGTSEGESGYFGLRQAVALRAIEKENFPVFLNLDHGKDLKLIKLAVDYGYDAVHFDGSGLSFKENIEKTKKIVDYAHKKGVLVEGELGRITGSSVLEKGKAEIRKEDLTSPDQVEEFVEKTGVNSLAVAVGSIHGVFEKMPKIDFDLLDEIRAKTEAFLVLHGGSGISKEDIKKAVKKGFVKVNNNTELRVAWKESLKRALVGEEVKPYKILPSVQKAVQKKVEEKIMVFGSKGKM